jgi:hypothetical protein
MMIYDGMAVVLFFAWTVQLAVGDSLVLDETDDILCPSVTRSTSCIPFNNQAFKCYLAYAHRVFPQTLKVL